MFHIKNASLKLFIFPIVLFLIFSFYSCSYAFSNDSFSNINSKSDKLKEQIQNFVSDIYQHYSKQNFSYIYLKLSPAVRDILTAEDYIKFQEGNFKKYDLEINDVRVGTAIEQVELPDKFSDFVKDDADIFKAKVYYEMSFIVAGIQQKRQTEKDVFILKEIDQLYLLWDPAIIYQ